MSDVSPAGQRRTLLWHTGGELIARNAPPDCTGAVADPDLLWPPNHKFSDVEIVGVADPDGDPVYITVDAIYQDEPLNGRADGNTTPDGGGIGTDTARLRAERSGKGDGRVYHVEFTADDGQGGSCPGVVTVCVPHDRRRGGDCMDQGRLFDSTGYGLGSLGTPSTGVAIASVGLVIILVGAQSSRWRRH
jgi:hypothetical protein